MCAGLTHGGELIASVESCCSYARAPVETEGPPFVACSVIGKKSDDGVIKFTVLFEVGNDASNSLVNVFHHGGEGSHATGEVFATVRGEVIPLRIFFSGESVGDVVTIDRNLGERWKLGIGANEAELLLPFKALAAEDVPAFAIGFDMAVD